MKKIPEYNKANKKTIADADVQVDRLSAIVEQWEEDAKIRYARLEERTQYLKS